MSKSRGFTLIEVMVALAVFAVVSVALVGNASSSLRHAGMIQNRTIAWWLAENQMTELRIRPRTEEDFPSVGTSRDRIEMNQTEWELEVDIENTEMDDMRRVTISVYKGLADEPAARLTGFLGRH